MANIVAQVLWKLQGTRKVDTERAAIFTHNKKKQNKNHKKQKKPPQNRTK